MSKALETDVYRVRDGEASAAVPDWIAVERPLEIRVQIGGVIRVLSTTMRTPGDDRALTAGFLFAERVISSGAQILALEVIDDDAVMV